MSEAPYAINVWVNAERYARLQGRPAAGLVEDAFAGLQVIRVPVTEAQKDRLLARYPMAKCDSSTTRTIELLPRPAKDRLFALIVRRQSADVAGAFLEEIDGGLD